MSYTKGKWSAEFGIITSDAPQGREHYTFIATVNPDHHDDIAVEFKDNANLIAAAPDLFEACKNLIALIQEGNPSAQKVTATVEIARKAVQKAKGD